MRKIQAMTLILGAMTAGIAGAATTTTTFAVTSSLHATCSATATPLAFAAYTPGGGNVANNSTISVKCTKNSPLHGCAQPRHHRRRHRGAALDGLRRQHTAVQPFTTAAFTTVFGDGSGASQTEAGTGAGVATAVAFTVFGQLPDNATNQAVVPGAYTDTITVTVTY